MTQASWFWKHGVCCLPRKAPLAGGLLLEATAPQPPAVLFSVVGSAHANHGGCTLLHAAAKQGHIAAAQLLVGVAPAALRAQSSDGSLPVHVATWQRHSTLAALLLLVAPDTAAALNSKAHSPLHLAAENCDVGLVALFLQAAPAAVVGVDRYLQAAPCT